MPRFPQSSDLAARAFALVYPAGMTWLYFVALVGQGVAAQQAALIVGKTIQFGFPLFWVLAVQRSGLSIRRPKLRDLGWGLALGLPVFAAMLGAYYAWLGPAGYLESASAIVARRVAVFGVHGWPQFLAMGVFYSLVHSLLEEYYWRWFVFGGLRKPLGRWPAICLSSVGFTGHHVLVLGCYFGWLSPLTLLFSLAVTVGGAFWAWSYDRCGSLYGPWLSHLLIDAAIFLIGFDLAAPALAG